jgi:hypothetical protein
LEEGEGAPGAGLVSAQEPAGREEAAPTDPSADGTLGRIPAKEGGDVAVSPPAGGEESLSGAGWEDLLEFCARTEPSASLPSLLKRMGLRREGEGFVLMVPDEFTLNRVREPEIFSRLEKLFLAWCGSFPALELASHNGRRKSREELKTEIQEHPLVREVQSRFSGHIIDYGQIR